MNDTQLTQISRYIEKARQDLLSNGSDDAGALLFLGEMQDPIPRTLIIDPTLNAIDVRIWMLLRISIANPVLPGKLPSQKELSKAISNSKMTIWSSMQVLRLNRWLTLCEKVRDSKGQNRGNVYAIHTEPLAISDTLKLDASYIEFIEQSLESKISRVKNNAMAAHIAFYKQINHHENTFHRTQLQQHEARLTAFKSDPMEKNHSILSEDEQNYYAHNFSQLENRSNYDELDDQSFPLSVVKPDKSAELSTGYKNCTLSKEQSTKIVPCQKSTEYKNCTLSEMAQQSHSSQGTKIGVGNNGSSSNIYNTKRLSNTTTTTTDQVKNLKSLDRLEKLILSNEIPIVRGILSTIPESFRQDVLDQLLGRLVNYQKTGQGQIYNRVGFIQTLKARVETGEFMMDSHGLMIQNGRQAECAQQHAAENTPQTAPEKTAINPEKRQHGMDALRDLKAKMKRTGGEFL